jgi:hypothetical protein
MTRAPDMTKTTPIHRRRLLRSHHDALTQLSMRQELITPTKYHAYQPNAGKADPALSPLGAAQQVRQFGSKANPPLKSP